MFIETFILIHMIFIRKNYKGELSISVHSVVVHNCTHTLCTKTITLSYDFNSKSAQLCVRSNVK